VQPAGSLADPPGTALLLPGHAIAQIMPPPSDAAGADAPAAVPSAMLQLFLPPLHAACKVAPSHLLRYLAANIECLLWASSISCKQLVLTLGRRQHRSAWMMPHPVAGNAVIPLRCVTELHPDLPESAPAHRTLGPRRVAAAACRRRAGPPPAAQPTHPGAALSAANLGGADKSGDGRAAAAPADAVKAAPRQPWHRKRSCPLSTCSSPCSQS